MKMEPVFKARSFQASKIDVDFDKCLICQASSSKPLRALTARGLATFKESILNRKDNVYEKLIHYLNNDEQFLAQNPKCHKECKSLYTDKNKIMAAKKRQKYQVEEFDLSEPLPPSSLTTRSSMSTINMKKCCFLCDKERDSKGFKQLVLVSSDDRQHSIHEKAKELNDQLILTKIQGYGTTTLDMVAEDFRYHRLCMTRFMNRKFVGDPINTKPSDPYAEAFHDLLSEISDPLLKNKSAFTIPQLQNQYCEILSKKDIVPNSSRYSHKNLCRRLKAFYGNDIQIIPQRGHASIVCSSQITVSEMCAKILILQNELDESQLLIESDSSDEETVSQISNHETFMAAKSLRKDIKEFETKQDTDMPDVDSENLAISYESVEKLVPNMLYNFIAWIISGTDHISDGNIKVALSEKEHEKVLNIAQDVMYSVNKKPMPKHVGLALHILRQTRSKDLVRILNRFGHSTSYDDAQRYITAMAQLVDSRIEIDQVFIPSNLKHGHFLQCAFDNLDFSEDTRDGTTLHSTTHIIYQYPERDMEAEPACEVPVKKRRRTAQQGTQFNTVESHLTLQDRRKARLLSPNIPLTQYATNSEHSLNILDDNFVWTLSQIYAFQEQLQPVSWNDFFEIGGKLNPKSVIAYGPTFPQSPTKPDVVQASLEYFMALTRKLGQDDTIVTCDQAIYDIVKVKYHIHSSFL